MNNCELCGLWVPHRLAIQSHKEESAAEVLLGNPQLADCRWCTSRSEWVRGILSSQDADDAPKPPCIGYSSELIILPFLVHTLPSANVFVSGEGLRRNALVYWVMEGTIYRGWEIQWWRRPGENPRAAAPDALAPQTAHMGGPNTHVEGSSIPCT
jgi:hypothetical protein